MATCAICKTELSDGQEVLLQAEGKDAQSVAVCQSCALGLEFYLQAETQNPNYLLALS